MRAYFGRYVLDTNQPRDNGGQYFKSLFRTGALSGMKRSPRTSTSLEVIVALWFYHWLLESRVFHYIQGEGLPADLNSTSGRLWVASVLE